MDSSLTTKKNYNLSQLDITSQKTSAGDEQSPCSPVRIQSERNPIVQFDFHFAKASTGEPSESQLQFELFKNEMPTIV